MCTERLLKECILSWECALCVLLPLSMTIVPWDAQCDSRQTCENSPRNQYKKRGVTSTYNYWGTISIDYRC
jgi:hypothetical protein